MVKTPFSDVVSEGWGRGRFGEKTNTVIWKEQIAERIEFYL